MSWNLLERFIESEHFNKDPALTVAYLARYANHVGIVYVLCSKLRTFSYEEIEFFLPQLCHLLISVDNESMALEEFLVDLCEESVNGALLTFWLFQTYLRDLAITPTSTAFRTCHRVYNKVQRIIFGSHEPHKREKIRDNVWPASVLSSLVLSTIAVPSIATIAAPLAIIQARKPRPLEERTNEEDAAPSQKLQRSHTVAGNGNINSPKPRRSRPLPNARRTNSGGMSKRPSTATPSITTTPSISAASSPTGTKSVRPSMRSPLMLNTNHLEAHLSSSSLPDMPKSDTPPSRNPLAIISPTLARKTSEFMHRRHSLTNKSASPTSLSPRQKIIILRSHYFRSQALFLTALEDISNRLVNVPKPARLSALRAELALIAQDLPAEVDIPLICPATLDDGSAGKSRHHRIVRLNPAEATSLNSAERVPYLLMLEVLREDLDFDPTTTQNIHLLNQLLAERDKPKGRLFDITNATTRAQAVHNQDLAPEHDSVFEPENGDLASPALLEPEGDDYTTAKRQPLRVRTPVNGGLPLSASSGRNTPIGLSARSSNSLVMARNLEPLSRSNSPGLRRFSPTTARQSSYDQPDANALATHMRAAAQMLAQLNSSSSKRPKAEVAAIQAKIIASMQTLEEQSFVMEDSQSGPTFDAILADTGADLRAPSEDGMGISISEAETGNLTIDTNAGAARMENDIKTGGVQRGGDRDDPSAATFGEAWAAKRERIRRSSPYGWMKNWDLVSVIVKTGADLRQEAFACQLIAVCRRIWTESSTDVWVKQMRILVTGESSGLIETITNGVSLHSLKRSLTLESMRSGGNPRKKIASLQDHFTKTFGEPDSPAHVAATENFAKSLAAYSTISYILQLKDRHNGNILIDDQGHIIHIDFGFMLSNSPGSMGFEAAPFKMTTEYVDVLGGPDGSAYKLFVLRMKEAFQALRRDAERIVMLVELMGKESSMACYGVGLASVVASLRARFVLEKSKEEAGLWVEELVAKSVGSYYTRLYDTFQYRTQGIY